MSKENNLNLTEMIKEIHDGVAREMYCKGIDDFVKFANTMPTVEEDDGTIRPMWLEEIAEQLKAKYIKQEVTKMYGITYQMKSNNGYAETNGCLYMLNMNTLKIG